MAEDTRAGTAFGGLVGRVVQGAALEAETATTDAAVEPVAQVLQMGNAGVDLFAEIVRNAGPVSFGRGAVRVQVGHIAGNIRQHEPHRLGDHHEGEAADIGPAIAAVAARVSHWMQDAVGLVEADGLDGKDGAVGQIVDSQSAGGRGGHENSS